MSTVRLLARPCWQYRRGGVGPTVEAGAVSESDRASIAAHPWSDIFLGRDRPPCGSGSVAAPSRSDCRGGRARRPPSRRRRRTTRLQRRISARPMLRLTARTSRDADVAYRGELLEGLDLMRTLLGIPTGMGTRPSLAGYFPSKGTRLVSVGGRGVARRRPRGVSTASGMGPPNRRPGDIRLRGERDHCPGSARADFSGPAGRVLCESMRPDRYSFVA